MPPSMPIHTSTQKNEPDECAGQLLQKGGPKEVKEIPSNKEQRAESAFCKDIMESLILAQDERWRRA